MSIWERVKRWRLSHTMNERDAPADTDTAMTRATGGASGTQSSTQGGTQGGTQSTTGTGTNDEFVGRVAGDDPDAEITGAEARAQRSGQD
jgi:hypothetical protein